MKRETMRHPKTFALMSLLGCTRPEALGYLTLLWDYTGDVAIQGDIGKWPNAVIAQACEWTGDADKFVDALAASGWLDPTDGPSRLVIHDWPHHCQDWVRKKLKRSKLDFDLSYLRRDGESVFVLRSETTGDGSEQVTENCPDVDGTVSGQCRDNGPTIPSNPIQSLPVPSEPSTETSVEVPTHPSELLAIIAWWNGLHAAGLVNAKVRTKPSKAILANWKRTQKNPEAREAISDLPALRKAIESSPFVLEGTWLSLAKLLGGKNKADHELIAQKILDGGYSNGQASDTSRTFRPVDSPARIR